MNENTIIDLNQNHLDKIKNIIKNYESEHPDCVNKIAYYKNEPSYYKNLSMEEKNIISMNFDWNYSKLKWYEFWIQWAILYCQNPILLIMM